MTHQPILPLLYLMMAMNATPQNISDQQKFSNGDSSSIDELNSSIARLKRSADWWNNSYLFLGAMAVIVAGATAYFQYVSVSKTRLLADTEAELSRVKESQLNESLKEKDVEIAALNRAAAYAQEQVANAELHIAAANQRAAEANAMAKESEALVASANAASKEAVAKVAEAQRASAEASAKAEGFRADIAKANTSADQARAETAKANLEVERLKRPRTLLDPDGLAKDLSPFKDTEYAFSGVAPDEESILLLRSIDAALRKAGWKRAKSMPGFPAVNIYGSDQDLSVPNALLDGVRIEVERPDAPLDASLPLTSFPQVVRTAVALNIALAGKIYPPENSGYPKVVNVSKGDFVPIKISVGRKVVAQ
jgi:hypothetical protein